MKKFDYFDKQEFWKNLEKAKFTKEQLEAIKYLTDVIDGLIGALGENLDQTEKNRMLLKAHKHLDGKVVTEV